MMDLYKTDVRIGISPCVDCINRVDGCKKTCRTYHLFRINEVRVRRADNNYRYDNGRITSYESERSQKAKREWHRKNH